jgi:DNA-binding response OmpR family regulator
MSKKHVCIVDDDAGLVSALKIRCEQLGLEVTTIDNGADAVTTIARKPPDLVLLDINMPAGDGLSVCRVLASHANLAPIPVIILSGRSDEETIRRCEALGAHYVLKVCDVWDWLRPRICEMLEIESDAVVTGDGSQPSAQAPTEPSPPKVLVIDDDPDIGRALKIKLAVHGVEVLQAVNGMQGYWISLKQKPDAIILDFKMPEGRGDYVLGRLKSHSITKDIPVVILTGRTRGGRTDYGLERELMGMGAVKFLTKPLDFDALLAELRMYMTLPSDLRNRIGMPQAALAP